MQATLHYFSERLRAASSNGAPVRFRGGGSKDFYGQSLQGEVFDTRAYRGILSYEPSELVITVRAGTPMVEVQAALNEQGQCLPFEPPQFGAATVGGMVASGLAGPARASVGTVRDFVLGVRMLNGHGQDLTFGGQVMKNVAGYDVSRLMASSLGQLGLITEVSLKVLPVTPGDATLVCAGVTQAQALALLNQWGGQPLPLNASAWVHDDTRQPAQDCLYVRLRGAVAAVEAAVVTMTAEVQALGATATRMDALAAAADWRDSGEQRLPFFTLPPSPDACLLRLSVPQTAPAWRVAGPDVQGHPYIEWHGAQRWMWASATQAKALRDWTHSVGGHAVLFRTSTLHGDADKSVGVFSPLDAVQQRIQDQLKKQFDPAGILNPGRI
jgi:glycolate oxidase FAD binding subunit